MTEQFLAVVVIYDLELKSSTTLQRLLLFKKDPNNKFDILVYDNSTTSQMVDADQSDFYYNHEPSNKGVSGAYNYAIELAISLKKKWLLLFDQDTVIHESYLKKLCTAVEDNRNEKLFCPIVRSNNRIVSPSRMFWEKPIPLKHISSGVRASKNCTVINSGLVVSLDEITAIGGYNSDLPLDFSDHYFFNLYKKRNKNFVIIDCVNEHNLSSDYEEDFKSVFNRFKKFSASSAIYSTKIHSALPLVWLFFRAVKLSLKFSKFEFVKFILFKK